MKVEGRWKVLSGSDMETSLDGRSWRWSMVSRLIQAIYVGLLKLSPASMVFALLPPHSFDVFGFRGLLARALRAFAPATPMMNLLVFLGLRDVSLSFYLFTYKH